jgi:hypothetical protein
MVQSALRLHGQMMHAGTAAATVAAISLREGIEPRAVAASPDHVATVQRILVRGAGGPGTLLWPWHDVHPEDRHFEAANLLTLAGIWRPDPESVFFEPRRPVTRRELAGALVRLRLALPDSPEPPVLSADPRFDDVSADDPGRADIETMLSWGRFGEQTETFDPAGSVSWRDLDRWLVAMDWEGFPTLGGPSAGNVLTRAEAVEFLWRVRERGR